jgi:hypothetical protein
VKYRKIIIRIKKAHPHDPRIDSFRIDSFRIDSRVFTTLENDLQAAVCRELSAAEQGFWLI